MGRRNRFTTCEWKCRYPNYMAAERGRFKKQTAAGKNLQLYLCRFCYGWHLTSHGG